MREMTGSTDRREKKPEAFELENRMVEDAICYAVEMHRGQLRKGTHRPYIFHPLEVLGILCTMRADGRLQAAGVLHDTIEDTEATYQDLLERFGTDVAELVNAHSADKGASWEEQKMRAVEHLRRSGHRLKMMIMADKVSNLRSMAADYRVCGEAIWDRFNAPKTKQAWYYAAGLDALRDMQVDPDTAPVYREMQELYREVFGGTAQWEPEDPPAV